MLKTKQQEYSIQFSAVVPPLLTRDYKINPIVLRLGNSQFACPVLCFETTYNLWI